MFLHVSVILVSGGVCLSACWDTPPGPGTPLGAHTPNWYQAPPRSDTPTGTRQPPPPGAVHAGRYGQQAGGIHSTGMHSCLKPVCSFNGLSNCGFHLSVCLPVYVSPLSIFLSVCMSVCLSVCLSVYLSIYLSMGTKASRSRLISTVLRK